MNNNPCESFTNSYEALCCNLHSNRDIAKLREEIKCMRDELQEHYNLMHEIRKDVLSIKLKIFKEET